MGAFIDDHQTYSWQEALPFMVNGEATAYLMGNFAVAPLREAGLTDDQLDFYQFPMINPDVDTGRRCTDRHVPHPVRCRRTRKRRESSCGSWSRPTYQTVINNGANLGQLPVNAHVVGR